MNLELVKCSERDDLIDKGDEIVVQVWPEFMLNDKVANKYFFQLYSAFPEYQYWILNGEDIVGIGNSIPLFWEKPLDDLPDEGWDWALSKGFKDLAQELVPNYLCALSITINPQYQGKGISSKMVKAMVEIGKENCLKSLILPVRPNQKTDFIGLSMQDYIQRKREDELPQDAWLRVHARLGGEIIKVCKKAMIIRGSVADWQGWTGMDFPKSGKYNLVGALRPIEINLKKDQGRYVEPNVWMVHRF